MYRYRCGQCSTTSPVVRTRVELARERDRHRQRVHGGHIPDGERLQRKRVTPQPLDRLALIGLAVFGLLVVIGLITR